MLSDKVVGIYGMGELGGHTYLQLRSSGVSEIKLFGKTPEKPEIWINSGNLGKHGPRTTPHSGSELSDLAEELDVLVITASEGNKYDLKGNTEKNKKILDGIAKQLGYYEGKVIVASNQTDTLCQYLAANSDVDPYRIYGVNGLDQARYRVVLENHFRELGVTNIEAYVAGFHHNSIILPSKTRIGQIPLEYLVTDEEVRKIDHLRRNMAGQSIRGIGTTSQEAAPIIRKLIEVIEEQGSETVSALTLYQGEPIFMSVPISRPEKWLETMLTSEKEALERIVEKHRKEFLAGIGNITLPAITSQQTDIIPITRKKENKKIPSFRLRWALSAY